MSDQIANRLQKLAKGQKAKNIYIAEGSGKKKSSLPCFLFYFILFIYLFFYWQMTARTTTNVLCLHLFITGNPGNFYKRKYFVNLEFLRFCNVCRQKTAYLHIVDLLYNPTFKKKKKKFASYTLGFFFSILQRVRNFIT